MCNNGSEQNYSYVYSYQADPRVLEAQKVQEEVMAHYKRNVEILTKEMTELKTILAAITMKYKVAEDARKVMYKRNSLLMDDNQFLQDKLRESEMQRTFIEKAKFQAEKEAKEKSDTVKRLETALKEIISEGLQDKKKRRALLVRERTTSTSDLPTLDEENLDIKEELEGGQGGHQGLERIQQTPAEKPLEEVERHEDDGYTDEDEPIEDKAGGDTKKPLKISNAPARAADRHRNVKLVRVIQEVERQKKIISWKMSELNIKSRELKTKEAELTEARREILMLKNKLSQNSLSRLRVTAKRKIENAVQYPKKINFRVHDRPSDPKTPLKKDRMKV